MFDLMIAHEKIGQVATILQEQGVDVWLLLARQTEISADPMWEYLAPSVTGLSVLILTRTGKHTAIIHRAELSKWKPIKSCRLLPYDETIADSLCTTLLALNPRKIAINYSEYEVTSDGISVGLYYLLLRLLQGTGLEGKLVSAEHIVGAIRGRKTATELLRLQKAIRTTERIFDEVEQFVMAGMNQGEISAFVHERVDRLGVGYAWDKNDDPQVDCGPSFHTIHTAQFSNPILAPGQLLHLSLGICQDGYCSQLQRTWYLLQKGESSAPSDVQNGFNAIYGALRSGEATLRAGVHGYEVDHVVRHHLFKRGYSEENVPFGHLIGRSIRDGATLLASRQLTQERASDLYIQLGQSFAIQVKTMLPDRGVIGIGENVLGTEEGVRYLSKPQTQLRYLR